MRENDYDTNSRAYRYRYSKWIWGTFLLLAAVFVLSNQLGGFVEIGVGSLVATVLAFAVFVQCLAAKSFGALPIPLAALYYIFQHPLNLPYIGIWTLIIVAILACIGLATLLPRKHKFSHAGSSTRIQDENDDDGNNPVVSTQFGSVSRYLHSECLETVQLECRFGALEVFFDQTQLSPDGAELICNNHFGSIELFIPRHWRVIDKLNCTFGGVEHKSHNAAPSENSPKLTISGTVTCGGIEIRYV